MRSPPARRSREEPPPFVEEDFSFIVAIVVYGMFYSAIAGSYGWSRRVENLASVYSAVKVAVPLDHNISLESAQFLCAQHTSGIAR